MPTFTTVKIADAADPGNSWGDARGYYQAGTRTADGTIWVAYVDTTKRYIYVKTSSDNGATWSAAEQVHDFGSAQTVAMNLWLVIGQYDGIPAVMYQTTSGTTNTFRFKRRAGGSWPSTEDSNIAPGTSGTETNAAFFGQTADGKYHFIYGSNGSNTDSIVHKISTAASSLASWPTTNTISNTGRSTSGLFVIYQQSGAGGCMDSAGNIHVVMGTVNLTGTLHYALVYTKYNGTTWSALELVKDAGDTVNYSKPVAPTITVDQNDVPHVFAHFGDPTSNHTTVRQAWYFDRVGGSWSAGEYPYGAAVTSDTQPAYAVGCHADGTVYAIGAPAGYGTNTTKKNPSLFDKATGSWVRTQLQDLSSDSWANLSPNSAMKKYARSATGVWMLWRKTSATELYMIRSSDQTWGLETRAATGTFNLGGVASQIGASFTPTVSTFSLSGRANFTRLLAVVSMFTLGGHAEEGDTSGASALLRVDSSRFLLAGVGTGVKTPSTSCTSTFLLAARANRVKTPTATGPFTLHGVAGRLTAATRTGTSTFNLLGTGRINFSLKKPVTTTFTLRGGAGCLPIEGCETSFAPVPSLPAEDAITAVYFQGPYGAPTYSLKLPRPEFGDGRKQTLQLVMHHTRGGDRRTFVRQPTYETLSLLFPNLSRKKLFEARRFLRATKGVDVTYVDHNGWAWRGMIVTPEPDLRTVTLDRGGELELEFEGEIVGA